MNILTIDLEEWFHVVFEGDSANWENEEVRILGNTDFILEALTSNNIKATFLVVGWIARRYPDLIKKIHQAGFEIGSHSDYHRVAYKLTKNEFRDDVKRSVDSLETLTGKKIRIFRAPFFSITSPVADYLETLIENGIEIDCSITSCMTEHGGFKNFPVTKPCLIKFQNSQIKEYPLSTYSLFKRSIIYSGGGYFRLLPFFIIKSIFEKQEYNMSYFHPRDFDNSQPAVNLSSFTNMKRNIGLKASRNKFRNLISSFKFIDIDDSDRLIDWNKAAVINF